MMALNNSDLAFLDLKSPYFRNGAGLEQNS